MELDKQIDELMYWVEYPRREEVKQAWLELIEREVAAARIEELKNMLEAEYVKGTFANPTPALNEFLEKTPLIASYVLRDRLQALKPSNNDKELSPGVTDTLTGWEKLNKEKE